MGKAPAVIIVVRHGARLDQADKQWHLTSPIPYDPPLTYGGWTQARALGARIAGILNVSEGEDGSARHSGDGTQHRLAVKQKHQVIIHSSPFTRCVQTSVAIGAGLAQSRPPPSLHNNTRSAEVRLDAFLGEWLSADYFEDITAPPSSATMVAAAKAELLRPGEPIAGSGTSPSLEGNFPGGWRREWNLASSADDTANNFGLTSMGAMARALPNRTRSSTHGGDFVTSPSSSRHHPGTRLHTRAATADLSSTSHAGFAAYLPPVPNYAISPSSPIPVGYVAHARDACVSVAYDWDSIAPPLCWGGGGEYVEEWSSMHLRFRTGLAKLIEWYEEHGPTADLTTEEREKSGGQIGETGDDEDKDLAVILVTHGAGCNALLGALTNLPVLMSVGVASLTMAVRKPKAKSGAQEHDGQGIKQQSKSNGTGIASDYEMICMASTDHLRPGSNPSSPGSIPAAGNTATVASQPSSSSRRATTSTPASDFSPIDNTATGLHRSMSGHSGPRTSANTSSTQSPDAKPRVSSGLWRQSMGGEPVQANPPVPAAPIHLDAQAVTGTNGSARGGLQGLGNGDTATLKHQHIKPNRADGSNGSINSLTDHPPKTAPPHHTNTDTDIDIDINSSDRPHPAPPSPSDPSQARRSTQTGLWNG